MFRNFHYSQLSLNRVDKVEDVVKIGDTLTVKVTEIDERGKVSVSHKATLTAGTSSRPAPKTFDKKTVDKKTPEKKPLDTRALERKFSDRKPFDRNPRDKYGNRSNRRRD